jgi:hypothetical protein
MITTVLILDSPRPHLRRDSARPGHICAGTRLAPATSAPGPFTLCGPSLTPKPWLACAVSTQMHDTCNAQRATCGMRHTTCNMQRATCGIQRATCGIQHATCNVQHAACNVQRDTCSVQRDTCSLQRAASTYNAQHAAQPAKRGTSESGPAWRIRISPGPSGARRTSLCVGSDARSVCRECNGCSVQHAVRDTQRSVPRQRALQPPCNLQRTAHGCFGAGSHGRSIAPLEPAGREKLQGQMPRIGGRQ